MPPRIAAALLLASALATAACTSAPPEPADLIVRGGVIRPTADDPPVAALAVRAGRVVAAGTESEVLRHRVPGTRVLDLAGATAVPGFGDARARPSALGESLLNDASGGALFLDLRDAQSEEDVVQRVRARSRILGAGEWILGAGWDERRWVVPRPPDRRLISDIVQNNPVLLVHAGGDPAWVNTKALDAAGIEARTPDPAGGRIDRERPGGAPSGLLWGRAAEPVLRRIPGASMEDRAAAILLGLSGDAALGVTMACAVATGGRLGLGDRGAGADQVLGPWKDLAARGRLPVRVALLVPSPSAAAEALLASGPEMGLGNGRLDIATILLDAAAAESGADGPEAWARRARERGFGVAIAARDPDSRRAALAALAAVRSTPARELPAGGASPVLRLDLVEAPDPAGPIDAGPGVVLVVPPPGPGGSTAPLQAARRAGYDVALAFDGIVAPPGPCALLSVIAGGWSPGDGNAADGGGREALRMVTLGPARAAGRGGEVGCLLAGCRADFVVLSRDPLAPADSAVPPVQVLATWLDGRPIYAPSGTR